MERLILILSILCASSYSAAATIYTGAPDFCDGADEDEEYAYDANGNMTMDANKGISSVLYNSLNLPAETSFDSGTYVREWRDASGRLLKRVSSVGTRRLNGVVVRTPPVIELRCGDFTYEPQILGSGFDLKRIEIPGGFIASDTAFWYLTDYQGNVRQVVNGATGSVVQKLDYYPYGTLLGETAVSKISGSAGASNPYKHGAKELLTAGGLNLYDYGARMSDPVTGRFTTPDPLGENKPDWSSYSYCRANPINFMDPSGLDEWKLNVNGEILENCANQTNDIFYIVDDKGQNLKTLTFEGNNFKHSKIGELDIFMSDDQELSKTLFEFLADNNYVEWGWSQTTSQKSTQYVTTSHEEGAEGGILYLMNNLKDGKFIEIVHSHPSGNFFPSGILMNEDAKPEGDMESLRQFVEVYKYEPVMKIYNPINKEYRTYNLNSNPSDFGLDPEKNYLRGFTVAPK